MNVTASLAIAWMVSGVLAVEAPTPRLSKVMTRCFAAIPSTTRGSQLSRFPAKCTRKMTGTHSTPTFGPQRAKRTNRRRATEPLEHNIHASPGEPAHPRQEILVAVIDRNRAEPLDRGAVAS